jgi:S-adenosylmethionine/arginine decarboxylase-like enzyme
MTVIPEHKHIIIRAEVKNPPVKGEEIFLSDWFKNLIRDLGMKLLSGPHLAYVDVPGNKGLTGVAIIETSHTSCHIWEESSPALVEFDFYTCGNMNIGIVMEALKVFDPIKIEYLLLDREHTITLLDKGEYSV